MPRRAASVEEDARKEVAPGIRGHRCQELGGGEGRCLHLLMSASLWLASPPSCRGGRQHIADVQPPWPPSGVGGGADPTRPDS